MRYGDLTSEQIAQMSYEDMMALFDKLRDRGKPGLRAANDLFTRWNAAQSQRDYDENRDIQSRNNNPLYQLGMSAGGAAIGGAGTAAGLGAWNALTQPGAGPEIGGVLQGSRDMSLPAFDWSLGGVPSTAGSGTTLGGTGSAGATTSAEGAGASLGLGPLALGALGVGATIGGHEIIDRYGNNETQNVWGGINAMNPINQAWGFGEEADNVFSGGNISDANAIGLAIPTAGASLLYNSFNNLWGSGKDADQQARDQFRNQLKDNNILGDDYLLHFSDNGTFDVGKDGGAMLKGGAYDGQRHYYDVNWGDSNAGNTVGAVDPLLIALLPDDEKLRSDFVGYYTNAALEGPDPMQRVRELYEKHGFSGMAGRNEAYNNILDLEKQGKISPEKRNALLASIDRVFGVTNPNQSRGGMLEFGSNFIA